MIDFQNPSFVKLKECNGLPDDGIKQLFTPNENAVQVYKGIRDYIVFTNKRIIVVNIQGMTGKKKDFTSIPYKNINTFSIETAGNFDRDCELEIYISAIGKLHFEFSGSSNIIMIGQMLSAYIL
jgi:hypothetical protein